MRRGTGSLDEPVKTERRRPTAKKATTTRMRRRRCRRRERIQERRRRDCFGGSDLEEGGDHCRQSTQFSWKDDAEKGQWSE